MLTPSRARDELAMFDQEFDRCVPLSWPALPRHVPYDVACMLVMPHAGSALGAESERGLPAVVHACAPTTIWHHSFRHGTLL